MCYHGAPQKQGMYDPQFEHDACGIGLLCNMKGKQSHTMISSAITILKKLAHRGGVGSEPDTGDGAGILIQMPHEFMKKVCKNEGFSLPKQGDYGVGMVFLSPDADTRAASLAQVKTITEEEGQTFLGVREVPVYEPCIGRSAREARPHICQVFIQKNPELKDPMDFERRLYVIGKRAEREIRYQSPHPDRYFYFSSLSARTICYKGMLTPDQVSEFYLELKDVDMKTAIALVHSRFSTNTFPSWERAHPNRFLVHNGEINTIRGNVNWEKAREKMFVSREFGEDLQKVIPIINEDGSDSAMLDNYIQFLTLSGYSLPEAIMTAMEYAGYQLVRGCGCRNGFCGACATIYRIAGDRTLRACLACQTQVEDQMYIATLPFFPLVKELYDIEKLRPENQIMRQLYPEIYSCIGCNACTKSCTQGLNVMQYIAYAQRGDYARCAQSSFDCVMCGVCSARCPAGISHPQVALLARRINGKYLAPPSQHLKDRVQKIKDGTFTNLIEALMDKPIEELKELYNNRNIEE